MDKIQNPKQFDLEERTFQFDKNVAIYVKTLPKTISNLEYGKQVVRSSGSVGSNYIEANEALSKKDFIMRIKICRKEGKESAYWLRLIVETNIEKYEQEGMKLFNEATELKKDILLYPFKITIVYFIGIL
jgi:four helix bundle protein